MCGDWAESVGLRYGSTLVQGKGSHELLTRLYYGGRFTTIKRLVWPVDLQRQEDGSILVTFPDIPEARRGRN